MIAYVQNIMYDEVVVDDYNIAMDKTLPHRYEYKIPDPELFIIEDIMMVIDKEIGERGRVYSFDVSFLGYNLDIPEGKKYYEME
tara:strand:- start:340 stop:591 length:252 start_codon:yes stop_codon:yes gene_type:complete